MRVESDRGDGPAFVTALDPDGVPARLGERDGDVECDPSRVMVAPR